MPGTALPDTESDPTATHTLRNVRFVDGDEGAIAAFGDQHLADTAAAAAVVVIVREIGAKLGTALQGLRTGRRRLLATHAAIPKRSG